jgi:hypothetical protein
MCYLMGRAELNDRMIVVNDESEGKWKEAAVPT